MAITNTVVTTGNAANVYVSSGNSIIATSYVYNGSGGGVLVELFLVPSGGTANITTQIYGNLVITDTDTYVLDTEKIILGDGDALMGNCNVANGATVTVSYTGA